jgi:hypothetical protein
MFAMRRLLPSLFLGLSLLSGAPVFGQAPDDLTQIANPRHGELTEREMAMARAAWAYFEKATQPETGLANSILTYPSTTMWDTASYLSALVSAYELGLIDQRTFRLRGLKVLGTLRRLDLFRGELPNKAYNTQTAEKVDYTNKPGEIGFSALDIGRLMVWLKIIEQRYDFLANSAEGVVERWAFCNVISPKGELMGAAVGKDNGTRYFQEGRLGYEEYAAKGFELWGFTTERSIRPDPVSWVDIYGVQVPYDGRDPRVYNTQDYVLTESYLLDGIELGWDQTADLTAEATDFTDSWRADFAGRIYLVQERRYEDTGILTARSEHQVEGAPYFVYDSIFSDGYPWNTLDTDGNYAADRSAVALKAAIGMWALWDTPYTDELFENVADLYDPSAGFFEGLYENGNGYIPLQTANNNGIILATLLFKAQGPIFRQLVTRKSQWPGEGPVAEERCRPIIEPVEPVEACSSVTIRRGTDVELEYCPIPAQTRPTRQQSLPRKLPPPPAPPKPVEESKPATAQPAAPPPAAAAPALKPGIKGQRPAMPAGADQGGGGGAIPAAGTGTAAEPMTCSAPLAAAELPPGASAKPDTAPAASAPVTIGGVPPASSGPAGPDITEAMPHTGP